jgi:hypothetical protein
MRLAATGLSIAAVPTLLFRGTAYAEEPPHPKSQGKSQGPKESTRVLDVRKPYDQATADRIHNLSVEQEIKEAGKDPSEVKAQANRRIRSLKNTV